MRCDTLAPHEDPAVDTYLIGRYLHSCNSGLKADGFDPQTCCFGNWQGQEMYVCDSQLTLVQFLAVLIPNQGSLCLYASSA